MKTFPCLLRRALILALLLCLAVPRSYAFGWPNSNDSMFLPAPAAKSFINIDGRGFLIHGQRTYIVAGEMQYSRVPRAQWRERLLRIKRAGYNTIQTYAFWNFHEPREGQFDFTTGNHNLNAYLKLIHSLGMYAIVRVGPYINAEWDTGGLPVWLRFKPGLRPMQNNAPFYAAVTPYWNRLLPIVMRNQINHGGAVIMVQLENEHVFPNDQQKGYPSGSGGGTDLPDAYYKHYQQVALKAGLQVPYFFSGLNHNDDPAGNDPFDISSRTTPWYSTEFWTGWVGWYSVSPQKQRKLVRATWKVIAYGGAGYTHYIMAGGSDFHTWNCNEQAASYDFGAPIGQAGDLRSDYYPLKRAALFATSFPKVLSDSLSANDGSGYGVTNSAVRITSRKGPFGTILFLDNNTDSPQTVQVKTPHGTLFPSAGPMTLQSGEIIPIVAGYPLLSNVNLALGAARVLGTTIQGNTTTLVAYGAPGEPGELHFQVPAKGVHLGPVPAHHMDLLTQTGTEITLKTKFPTGAPDVFTFRVGSKTIRVLAESAGLADRTWFVPVQGQTEIICGPDYVGEAGWHKGQLVLHTEQTGLSGPASPYPTLYFDAAGLHALAPIIPAGIHPAPATAPALGAWQVDASVPQAQPAFNDSSWLQSDQPKPMGADGGYGAYAWYRTVVTPPAAGTYQLDISDAGDWVTAFVNGKRQGSTDVEVRFQNPVPRQMNIHLNAGPNTLALLTAHYGRNKLFNYYGSLRTIDAKGISGTVTLTRSQTTPPLNINAFRWKADDNGPKDAATMAAPGLDTSGAGWATADTTTDVFHGRAGYAWFRTSLPTVPGPGRQLIFASIDDLGTVYLNGKQLASGVGINQNVHVNLDPAWNSAGPNVLAVLVQNTSGAGGLLGKITLQGGFPAGTLLHGWRMHGGETPPAADAPTWKPLPAGTAPGVPAWYRTSFIATPPAVIGPHPILRVHTIPLSRGFVWLNGHNLGRYPEVSVNKLTGQLVDGVYLPECWLKRGKNTLMIFDEDGVATTGVKIIIEQAASRRDFVLASR